MDGKPQTALKGLPVDAKPFRVPIACSIPRARDEHLDAIGEGIRIPNLLDIDPVQVTWISKGLALPVVREFIPHVHQQFLKSRGIGIKHNRRESSAITFPSGSQSQLLFHQQWRP